MTRRQRPHEPVGPTVERVRPTRVGGERPAVDGEDPDRNAGERSRPAGRGRRPSSCSRGGCPGGSGAAGGRARRDRPDRAGLTARRTCLKRHEPCARRLGRAHEVGLRRARRRSTSKRSTSAGSERGDVGLGAADLGERDQQEDRAAAAGRELSAARADRSSLIGTPTAGSRRGWALFWTAGAGALLVLFLAVGSVAQPCPAAAAARPRRSASACSGRSRSRSARFDAAVAARRAAPRRRPHRARALGPRLRRRHRRRLGDREVRPRARAAERHAARQRVPRR